MSQSAKPTPAVPGTPRVPLPAHGIDVNFCRNRKCSNFGITIPQTTTRGPGADNPYTVVANGRKNPAAKCNACGEAITFKSNAGVVKPVGLNPSRNQKQSNKNRTILSLLTTYANAVLREDAETVLCGPKGRLRY